MGFRKLETRIEGLLIIEPDVFADDRGYFMELYQKERLKELGVDETFVQDNLSYSRKDTLRGLHFQAPPHAQGKLVTVLQGTVLDVAVDIRKDSPTYGAYEMVELSDQNHRMFWVPPGFAHGFAVLSETCLFHYKCSGYYNKAAEGGLMWNDPEIGIEWDIQNPVISQKDQEFPAFSEFKSPF